MNLCTDQLAMLVAAPGQLIAVSDLARDPFSSSMAEAARDWPAHHSGAEEVFGLTPDLVLAGLYTSRASVSMLRRLGLRVEEFEPAASLADVTAQLERIGVLLGREEAAARQIAAFEADLAAYHAIVDARPRAALYYANGYSLGDRTLAGQILLAAGFDNIATELGRPFGGNLSLEELVMTAPDLVVTGEKYPGASRSEALLDHPALQSFRSVETRGADWICGTPFVLRAIADLREAAR